MPPLRRRLLLCLVMMGEIWIWLPIYPSEEIRRFFPSSSPSTAQPTSAASAATEITSSALLSRTTAGAPWDGPTMHPTSPFTQQFLGGGSEGGSVRCAKGSPLLHLPSAHGLDDAAGLCSPSYDITTVYIITAQPLECFFLLVLLLFSGGIVLMPISPSSFPAQWGTHTNIDWTQALAVRPPARPSDPCLLLAHNRAEQTLTPSLSLSLSLYLPSYYHHQSSSTTNAAASDAAAKLWSPRGSCSKAESVRPPVLVRSPLPSRRVSAPDRGWTDISQNKCNARINNGPMI